MKIFICGYSGAGKTTLLESLQKKSGSHTFFQFYDLDQLLVDSLNKKYERLGQWIQAVGEQEFRAKEQSTLKNLIANNEEFVLALGGGALTEDSYQLIKNHPENYIVFLDTPFEVCFERIKNDSNRLLSTKPFEELEKIYSQRKKIYQKADLIISNESLKFIEGLDSLVHTLRKH